MLTQEQVTLVIPSSNNLRYLKNAYQSIKTHAQNCKIVMLDDGSTDGTTEWLASLSDDNITAIYRSSERVGHTVLYDKGIELAQTEVVGIMHADMILGPYYLENTLKHLQKETVVCATRVEPPLHPAGKEKIIKDFGTDFDNLNLNAFEAYVLEAQHEYKDLTTNGMFAPWIIYKEDFVAMGGHDRLFAPFPYEDSDIFQRWILHGYELIQSRDAFVYHMTCRGSRFKDGIEIEKEIPLPDGTIWYKPKDSKEYLELRQNKFKEWWRKWHTDVLHDELMMPIVPNRYDTTFVVHNCAPQLLGALEPWCDRLYVDCEYDGYVTKEQNETMFDLSDKIHSIGDEMKGDVQIMFDGFKLTNENFTSFIKNIPFIVQQTDSVGSFEWDIFQLHIFNLTTKDMVTPFFKNIF